ncbi:OmpA family protein [Nitrospiraceae bacterium AH_259_D15_M11_P09]|nr:OmpA family protein [Nitrospiraceae bacterium AH_259_D15_M11_P09]
MSSLLMLIPVLLATGWATAGISSVFGAVLGFVTAQPSDAIYASPAGFIRETLPVEGRVSTITGDNQFTGNRRLLGLRDQLYLDLTNPEEVTPGDLLTIYRRIHQVFHPLNGTYLGDLVSVRGVVKVKSVTLSTATVNVVRSYKSIAPEDSVMRYVPAPVQVASVPERQLPVVPGVIVDLPHRMTLIAQGHVVYVDWGREDGLRLGDRLETFRVGSGLPVRVVAELEVVALEDHTASARVARSMAPLLRGDRFTFKESSREQKAVGESEEDEIGRFAQTLEGLSQPSQRPAVTEEPETTPVKVSVHQDGEQLTITLVNLVEQLGFDEGEAYVKPDGRKVLKQISEILKGMTDKHIRIEGHADSKPIGPSLMSQFPTNWELSEARASGVAQFFVEEGGLDSTALTTIGYGDTQPASSNATEEGRRANRRIEILLFSPGATESVEEPITPSEVEEIFKMPPSIEEPALPAVEPIPDESLSTREAEDVSQVLPSTESPMSAPTEPEPLDSPSSSTEPASDP